MKKQYTWLDINIYCPICAGIDPALSNQQRARMSAKKTVLVQSGYGDDRGFKYMCKICDTYFFITDIYPVEDEHE